jgi:hypothetical protein
MREPRRFITSANFPKHCEVNGKHMLGAANSADQRKECGNATARRHTLLVNANVLSFNPYGAPFLGAS